LYLRFSEAPRQGFSVHSGICRDEPLDLAYALCRYSGALTDESSPDRKFYLISEGRLIPPGWIALGLG
jgi:hypothetical protein